MFVRGRVAERIYARLCVCSSGVAFSVCVALELLAAISRSKTFFYAQNKQNSKGGCSSIRPTPSRFQCCMVNCLHTNRNKHVPRIRLLVIFSIKTRQKKTFHLTLSWSTRSVQTRLQTKKEPTFALMTCQKQNHPRNPMICEYLANKVKNSNTTNKN